MIDPRLRGPRVESYGIDVLDREEKRIGVLRNRFSASVEQNVDATIRGGLTLAVRDKDIDWSSCRFRPWARVNGLAWTLGIYLPSKPARDHDTFGDSFSSSCLDKLSILDEFGYDHPVSVPSGTVVTTAVQTVIETDVGEESFLITPSSLTLAETMVWPAGTSALRVVNDLLGAINYSSVWCDKAGRYRVEPYVLPRDRPVSAEFLAGETSIHSPKWKISTTNSVPNRVVVATQGSDTSPGLQGVSENWDPDDPYSYPSRGRWVTRTYSGAEAADQATLDALAERYRLSLHPISYIDVSHALIPMEPNDVVRFSSNDVDQLASINEYRFDLRVGALVSAKWSLL